MAEIRMPEGNSTIKDNSNRAKQEMQAATKPAPIVHGTLRKRNIADRFAEVFFEGTLKDAVDYLVNDLAIPTIKNGLISAIEVMFFGGSSRSSSSIGRRGENTPYYTFSVSRDGTRTNYNRPYQQRPQKNGGNNQVTESTKRKFDPRRIRVDDRGMAERVLEDLKQELRHYDQVSVERLFDLVGIDSDWTSTSYGWAAGDLDNARVRPCPGGGWCFDLPEPYPID